MDDSRSECAFQQCGLERLFPLPGLSATPFPSQIPGLGMECHTCEWAAPVSCFQGLCLGRGCPTLTGGSELGRGVELECPSASLSSCWS